MTKKPLKITLVILTLLACLGFITILYLYLQLPPWPKPIPGVDFDTPKSHQISPKEVKKDNAAFYLYQLDKIENFEANPFSEVMTGEITPETKLAADELIANFPHVIEILENAVKCDYCLFALNNEDGTFNQDATSSRLIYISAPTYFLYMAELAFSKGKITEGYNAINKFAKIFSFQLQTKPDYPISRFIYDSGLDLIVKVLNKRLIQLNSQQELALLRQLLTSLPFRKVNFSWGNFEKFFTVSLETTMHEKFPNSAELTKIQKAIRDLATHRIKAYELYDQTGILGVLSDNYKKVVYETENYQLLLYGKWKGFALSMARCSFSMYSRIAKLEFTRAKLNAIHAAISVKTHFNKTGNIPSEITEILSKTELDRAKHYNHSIRYKVVNKQVEISVEGSKPFIITPMLTRVKTKTKLN